MITKNRTLWDLACGLLDIKPVTALILEPALVTQVFGYEYLPENFKKNTPITSTFYRSNVIITSDLLW